MSIGLKVSPTPHVDSDAKFKECICIHSSHEKQRATNLLRIPSIRAEMACDVRIHAMPNGVGLVNRIEAWLVPQSPAIGSVHTPKHRIASGARLPQPRSTETSGSGGRAADRQSRACLSAASLRGGPEVEYCRWSPEGPAAVERQTRCGALGPPGARVRERAWAEAQIEDQSTIYRTCRLRAVFR